MRKGLELRELRELNLEKRRLKGEIFSLHNSLTEVAARWMLSFAPGKQRT